MRKIGAHLRLHDSLEAVALYAQKLHLKTFQCFFLNQSTKRLIEPSKQDIDQFLRIRDQFTELYVHAAYWVNLAHISYTNHQVLEKELELARQYAFTHLIIHPGTTKGSSKKKEGIEAVARTLNRIFKQHSEIQIVLENVAHNGLSIGGDLTDFSKIKALLDKPELLSFCIDTAHAYAFGYDIANDDGLEQFMTSITETIGFTSIALIHLNNTQEPCKSYIDRHCLLNEGKISIVMLQKIVNEARLQNIPLILELPVSLSDQLSEQLTMIRSLI